MNKGGNSSFDIYRAVFCLWLCSAVFLGCSVMKSAAPNAVDSGESEPVRVNLESPAYVIGSGDILFISVWNNKELTKKTTVLPDGIISFPLIGEIRAEGKTIDELKKELVDKLSPRYIHDPVLFVEVREIRSTLIYVIGKVNDPGRFSLHTRINVLQALSMAGGLNPFAKTDRIKIFREGDSGTQIFNFRYDDVTEGKNLDQNIRLQRGDVIVVP